MDAIRKHSWWGLLIIAVVVGLFGLGDLASGVSADSGIVLAITGQTVDEIRAASPTITSLADLGVRVGGATMITAALLWSMILVAGVRVGERWAWMAMWTLPLWTVLVTGVYLAAERIPDQPPPPPLLSGPVLLVLAVVLLAASRPRTLAAPSIPAGTTADATRAATGR